MATLMGTALFGLEMQLQNMRQFAFKNRNFFEIGFVLLYALEQLSLIYFITFQQQRAELIISVYVVILLTTFALNKVLMQSIIRQLEDRVQQLGFQYTEIEKDSVYINSKYKELVGKLDGFYKEYRKLEQKLNKHRAPTRRL